MNENLKTISRILGHCTLISILLLSVWFAAYKLPGNLLCDIHGGMFDFSHHECALMTYAGMGFVKVMVMMFFFFPWLAIKIELRRRK